MSTLTARIKTIQQKLGLPKTGTYDAATIHALEGILLIYSSNSGNTIATRKKIQKRLGFTGSDVDGMLGTKSTEKIEEIIRPSVMDNSELPERIKRIQGKLSIAQTGTYNLATINGLESYMDIRPLSGSINQTSRAEIQKRLGFSSNEQDGILGAKSTSRIEAMLQFLELETIQEQPFNERIKSIQNKLLFPQTGQYDLRTINALERNLVIEPLSENISEQTKKTIQEKLGLTGDDVDGIFGKQTTAKIEIQILGSTQSNSTDLSARISKIQRELPIPQTGVYDLTTLNALEYMLNIHPLSDSNTKQIRMVIQRKLGFTGNDVDGIFGVDTTTRIENYLRSPLPPLPDGASLIVSKKSLDLIVESEIGSADLYMSKYKYPTYPGGNSGITIGIGYDLGQVSVAVFRLDWDGLLTGPTLNALSTVVGLQGTQAKNALTSSIKALIISYNAALEVLYTKSLPIHAKGAARIYPEIKHLPPDAQGALLSLVYNRGTSLSGSRRTEMKNIVKWVKERNLPKIAAEFRSMKRLWANLPGLIIRREKEAVLIENAAFNFLPQDLVIV